MADLSEDNAVILGQDFWRKQRTILYNNLGQYAFYLNGRRVPLLANDNSEKVVNRVLLTPEVIPTPTRGKPPVSHANDPDSTDESFLNKEVTAFRELTLDPHQKVIIKVQLPKDAPAGQQVLLQQIDPQLRFPDQRGTVLEGQM